MFRDHPESEYVIGRPLVIEATLPPWSTVQLEMLYSMTSAR
jgi:hypothetical protein